MRLERALLGMLVAAALVAPPASADRPATPNVIELPPYTSPCDEAADAQSAIGGVTAISGTATHASPGCAPSPLGCEAFLREGDRLATTDGGELAMQVGGAWVQLAGDSAATLRRETDGSLVLALERGRVRVMRIGDGAVPRVETPELAAVAPGDDVAARAGDGASSLCSWSDPVEVRTTATGRIASAPTGGCVAPGAQVAAALDVSTADVARCDVAVGDLTPFDVAAPPVAGTPPVFPPPPLPPPLCQNGSCGGTPKAPRIPVIEQPGGFEPPP